MSVDDGDEASRRRVWRVQVYQWLLSVLVSGAPGALLFLIAALNFFYFDQAWEENPWVHWVLLPLLAAAGVMLGLAGVATSSFRRLEKMQEPEAALLKAEKQALNRFSNPPTLKELWLFNRAQMDRYDHLTRSQAKDSYRRAQWAMAAGMLVLVIGSLGVVLLREPVEQVTTGILTALGTTLAGYVSKTYLDTYRTTINQLNYYYQEPLDSSFLLRAERLARERDGKPTEEMLNRIVAKILERPFSPLPTTLGGPKDQEARPPASNGNQSEPQLRKGQRS